MLRHPPVSEGFLRHIGQAEFLDWGAEFGVFTVLRRRTSPPGPSPAERRGSFLELCLAPPPLGDYPQITIDRDVELVEPPAVADAAPHAVAHCFHGSLARELTVRRSDSPNRGRMFFVCQAKPACKFFRWKDDLLNGVYSDVEVADAPRSPPSHALSPLQQVAAWYATAQGSAEWLRLRFGRITASNFGTITGTNPYSSPEDYLRSLLWPTRLDGVAMRWGSINEHVASRLFQEFLADQAGNENVLVEDRGIWIPGDLPYVGGSPDGVVYQVESVVESNSEYEVLRCSRSLLEIKTPWKHRNRRPGDDFYPRVEVPEGSGRHGCIPPYYYDQINGNCALMGLKAAYFVVLTRTGFQVTHVPFAPAHWDASLRPRLERFYLDRLRPGQELQAVGHLPVGTVPLSGVPKRVAAAD